MGFDFFRERKWQSLTLAVLLFFIASLFGARAYFEYHARSILEEEPLVENISAENVEQPVATVKSERVAWLTGLPVTEKTDSRAVAVVIENHPASRSQMRGLNEAGLVIEALTEGGITRYLAFFELSELKRVGPVRSARPYFIEWAAEFGGALVHAGGSVEALEQLAETSLLDFDEDGEILYRDFRYLKPHNLFANLAEVRAQLAEKKWSDHLTKSWFDFGGEIPTAAEAVKEFALDFSLPSYFVNYVYDPAAGNYRRRIAGVEHTSNGNAVRPVNVIVQFTEYWPIDEEGRLELRTDGEDIAWYFSGGKWWRGTWRKTGNRTQFFDALGQSVSLQPGQTFIEVLDNSARVQFPTAE